MSNDLSDKTKINFTSPLDSLKTGSFFEEMGKALNLRITYTRSESYTIDHRAKSYSILQDLKGEMVPEEGVLIPFSLSAEELGDGPSMAYTSLKFDFFGLPDQKAIDRDMKTVNKVRDYLKENFPWTE